MEALEIIKFYSIDIIILMFPILFIVISTIKNLPAKHIITYGVILSAIASVIIQSRYPSHAHVPGSGVFFVITAMLICLFVMVIALFLRKLTNNDKNT